MSDSVWRALLAKLEKLDAEHVAAAMRSFVEKHADGEKDERYLLGIARRLSKAKPRTPQTLHAAPNSSFVDEDIGF
jgi:hypothetical protein